MSRSFVGAMFTLLATTLPFYNANAQRVLVAAGQPASQATLAPYRLLSTPVTVSVKGVSLKQAVDAITKSAGIPIQYPVALLEAHRELVTLDVAKVPLSVVLSRVLAGTTLRVVPDGGTQFMIVESEQVHAVLTDGTIVGKVMHAKTKQPIVNATITVAGTDRTVVTGGDGTFRLTVPEGERQVNIRAVGMARQSRTVAVVAEQAVSVVIELDPAASVLDEVVVTGTVVETERRALSTPITVITAEDIERRGITRIDQLFRGEVPGVVAIDIGTAAYTSELLGAMQASNVFARGSTSLDGSPNPLKTYVDGVEITDSKYLGLIDPKSIERIEIIAGPQAATIYGSGAMGGVMQIFTKRGMPSARPQITLSIVYGMLENNLNSGRTPVHSDAVRIAGGRGSEFSYSGSFSHNYTGQWQSGLFARNFGVAVGVTHTNGPLKLDGSYTRTRSTNGSRLLWNSGLAGPSWLGELGESPVLKQWVNDGFIAPGQYPLKKDLLASSQSQQIAFNLDWRLLSFWQHHLTFGEHTQEFDRRPEEPTFINPSDTMFWQGASRGQRSNWNYNTSLMFRGGWLSSAVTFGANRTSRESRSLSGYRSSAASAAGWVGGGRGPVSIADGAPDANWGGFGTVRFGFADNIFVNLSIRGERNAQYGGAHGINWSPNYGISVSRDVGDLTVKLLTSFGEATRAPVPGARDPGYITYYVGFPGTPQIFQNRLANPYLGPEYSSGWQGGTELYFGSVASITVNRYVQRVEDLVSSEVVDSIELDQFFYTEFRPVFQNFNSASMKAHGWATTATLRIARVNITGSYSWDDSRVKFYPQFPDLSGRSLYAVPTHYGSLSAAYAWGKTSVSLVNNYVGSSVYDRIRTDLDVIMTYYLNALRYRSYVALGRFEPARFGGKARPGNVRTNFTASHQVTSMITGTVNIANLGNGFGSDIGAFYPTLGRQTQLGLSLRW